MMSVSWYTTMMRIMIFTVCGISATVSVNAAENSKINWSVTPFIWAVDTTVDLTADGTRVGSEKISFSDLMDATDESYQVAIEAGRDGGKWTGFIDLTYLDASDDDTDNVSGTNVRIDTDTEQWFVDVAVAYWPWGEAGGLNVFGGIRYTDIDDRYDVSDLDNGQHVGTIKSARNFTDALFGVRHRLDMTPRWSLLTRADYAFGDSDGIYVLQALFRYAVGKRRQNGIIFGYRYKEAELEDGGIEEDYEYKGPSLAFNFRF